MSQNDRATSGESLLERVDWILDAIQEAGYLTLTGVVERTGLARSTAHRLLLQMEHRNWLFRVGTNYELGPRLFDLGIGGVRDHWFYRRARPAMESLYDLTGGLVHLAFLRDREVVFWDALGSRTQPTSIDSQIGAKVPVHATALGKALMASQPPGLVATFAPFQGYTSATIDSPTELQRSLEIIRRDGYAWDWGEYRNDIGCVATPLHAEIDNPSSTYRTTAALSICLPLSRLDSRLLTPLMQAKRRFTQLAKVNPMIDPHTTN